MMTRREAISYAISTVIVSLILLGVYWLMVRADDAPPVESKPQAQAMAQAKPTPPPRAVLAELPKAEPKAEPKPEPKPKSDPPPEGSGGLASRTEGKDDQTVIPPKPMPPVPPMPKPMPPPPTPKPMKADVADAAKPKPMPPQEVKPMPPKVQPVVAQRANQKGLIPPIRYEGRVEILRSKYPRIEMLWLHADPDPGRTGKGPVEWQFVLDPKSGGLAYEYIPEDRKGGDFTLTTMRYNTASLVAQSNPSTMKLWGYRDAIEKLSAAKKSHSVKTHASWGYIRHNAEIELLQPAREAYVTAEKAGKIVYDPKTNATLRIIWGGDDATGPIILEVWFQPETGAPVRLK